MACSPSACVCAWDIACTSEPELVFHDLLGDYTNEGARPRFGIHLCPGVEYHHSCSSNKWHGIWHPSCQGQFGEPEVGHQDPWEVWAQSRLQGMGRLRWMCLECACNGTSPSISFLYVWELICLEHVDIIPIEQMDVSMPFMGSMEVTELIHAYKMHNNLSPTPIIALTAHASACHFSCWGIDQI